MKVFEYLKEEVNTKVLQIMDFKKGPIPEVEVGDDVSIIWTTKQTAKQKLYGEPTKQTKEGTIQSIQDFNGVKCVVVDDTAYPIYLARKK